MNCHLVADRNTKLPGKAAGNKTQQTITLIWRSMLTPSYLLDLMNDALQPGSPAGIITDFQVGNGKVKVVEKAPKGL